MKALSLEEMGSLQKIVRRGKTCSDLSLKRVALATVIRVDNGSGVQVGDQLGGHYATHGGWWHALAWQKGRWREVVRSCVGSEGRRVSKNP